MPRMSHRLVWLVALVACSARSAPVEPPAPPPARDAAPSGDLAITYVANEGVLLESGGVRVLIDGLFRPTDPTYARVPADRRVDLERAAPPWADIDVVLVSHRHRDHFDPEAVSEYLVHAYHAELVSSQEVVAELERAATSHWELIRDRVLALSWQPGRSEEVRVHGVAIHLLGLSHGSGAVATVQNFGHVVELGSWRLLHLGDAVATEASLAPFHLGDGAGIDVAFVPWWYLADEAQLAAVQRLVAPRRIVFVHVGPSEEAEAVRLAARVPDAVVFRRVLEDKLVLPARR